MTDSTPADPTREYRALGSAALPKVFMSLGLPRSAFTNGSAADERPFDAVLNADAGQPDILWLFKGSDFYHYDLASDRVVGGPDSIIGSWPSLPGLFQSGIHSAVWSGPAYPNLWTFFKDETYVTLDISTGWGPFQGPRGILGAWGTGAWADAEGNWRTPGVPTALHGLGSTYDKTIHFFKDGEYLRHDLSNGGIAQGPLPIGDVWKLPVPFLDHVDYAFYGTGAHEEHINFISGDQYALYDFRTRTVLDQRPLVKRFPVFAQFLGRPQLFLAEDYTLDTLVGPVSLGRLLDTRSIGAGSTIERILVTQTTHESKTSLTSSVLQSSDSAVTRDLAKKVDDQVTSGQDAESYKYQLAVQAHGDASADSLWGGEVNFQAGVQGQTESLRSHVGKATFESVASQVQETQKVTEQHTYASESEVASVENVLKKEVFKEVNDSDHVRVYEFYEQLQAYLTLFVLHGAVVAYSDGFTVPRIIQLPAVRALLTEVLADSGQIDPVMTFIRQEVSRIVDQGGEVRSLVADAGGAELVLRDDLTTTYTTVRPDGSTQAVLTSGIVKSARSWVEPTYTILCVQHTEGAGGHA